MGAERILEMSVAAVTMEGKLFAHFYRRSGSKHRRTSPFVKTISSHPHGGLLGVGVVRFDAGRGINERDEIRITQTGRSGAAKTDTVCRPIGLSFPAHCLSIRKPPVPSLNLGGSPNIDAPELSRSRDPKYSRTCYLNNDKKLIATVTML
jgi:hypothetical protein